MLFLNYGKFLTLQAFFKSLSKNNMASADYDQLEKEQVSVRECKTAYRVKA